MGAPPGRALCCSTTSFFLIIILSAQPYQLALRAVRGAQGEAPQEALPGTASAAPPDALNASLYAAYTVAGERVRDLEQRFSFSGGDIVARFQVRPFTIHVEP